MVTKVRVVLFLISLTVMLPVLASQDIAKRIVPIVSFLLLDGTEELLVPLQHKAVLKGPISGAQIEASALTDGGGLAVLESTVAVESSKQLSASGTFLLEPISLQDSDWVLVSASGGSDVDADGDNVPDASPIAFQGVIHALAGVDDWNNGNLTISPLTEIVWRYTEGILPLISLEDLPLRLDDIARALFISDVNDDGLVDYSDILAFEISNPAHTSKLSFDIAALYVVNEDGNSIISSLGSGSLSDQLSLMQQFFGHLLVFNPVPDSRYKSVAIQMGLLGSGSVSSDSNPVIAVDSTGDPLIYEDTEYFSKNASEPITFTAVPTHESNIASWKGCDAISSDLTQCTINKSQSRSVMAIFEQKEVGLKGAFHDLTLLDLIVTEANISFVIPSNNIGLIDQLAVASVGDFVAGDEGDGFLREITAITRNSNVEYELSTTNANLEDVISNGTVIFETALTNGDLVDDTTLQSAFVSAPGVQSVQLLKSKDASDKTFKILLGDANQNNAEESVAIQQKSGVSGTLFQSVDLYKEPACLITPDDCGKITARGELSLELDLDVAADYSASSGMRYFEFSVNTKASESFEITATKSIAKIDRQRKLLGTLLFKKILVSIGVVPLWVTPRVDIFAYYEGEIRAEATFKVGYEFSVRGGVRYTKSAPAAGQSAWGVIKAGSIDPIFDIPTTSVEAKAQGGIEVFTGLKLYDITGPKIKADAGLKVSASTPVNLSVDGILCYSGTDVALGAFADIGFNWDLSGNTKFGRFLHLQQIEESTRFTIYKNDWPLYDWNLLGNCPSEERAFLIVAGNGIIDTVDQGDTSLLTSTVELGNSGDKDLNWEIFDVPDYMQVSNISGFIPVGDITTSITMSIDPSGLSPGIHRAVILFRNMDPDAAVLLDRSKLGDTEKTIEITVLPENSSANVPTLAEFSTITGGIGLSWTHSPAVSEPAYIGYRILYSIDPTDPNGWSVFQTTSINVSSLTVNSFPLDQVGYVAVQAFNLDSEGARSNIISIGKAVSPFLNQVNDTGLTFGGGYISGINAACSGDSIAQQDCFHGRDTVFDDDSDGHAGFSFTKLDEDGNELLASANSWACVKDNVSGLVWEVKTDDGGIHDKDNIYRWGGKTVQGSGYGIYYSDWDILVDGSNSEQYCGISDWRVPSFHELSNIVDFGLNQPAIDTNYFPNTTTAQYWSSSPSSSLLDAGMFVSFALGESRIGFRYSSRRVRLVK